MSNNDLQKNCLSLINQKIRGLSFKSLQNLDFRGSGANEEKNKLDPSLECLKKLQFRFSEKGHYR